MPSSDAEDVSEGEGRADCCLESLTRQTHFSRFDAPLQQIGAMNVLKASLGPVTGHAEHSTEYKAGFKKSYPVQTMFSDWWKNKGQFADNIQRAFSMGGADRAQVVNEPWLDQLLRSPR